MLVFLVKEVVRHCSTLILGFGLTFSVGKVATVAWCVNLKLKVSLIFHVYE